MQDIDFAPVYRRTGRFRQKQSLLRKTNSFLPRAWPKSYVFLSMLLFGLGMYLGSRYERFVITRQMETQTLEKESAQKSSDEFRSANLPPQEIPNPTLSEDTGSPTKQNAQNIEKALRESRELYLILARIYSDEKEAYRHGHQLKQMGFPVFLAKSGQKTKIYVGPLEGKKEAYEQLAKIKAMSNFRGAILYKK